jgi:hypothetical protein
VSDEIEFLDSEPSLGIEDRVLRASPAVWSTIVAAGWAVAAGLALIAPFLPFTVYPTSYSAPGADQVSLEGVGINGWSSRGEEPRVGIVLAICAALLAINALAQLSDRWFGMTVSNRFNRWRWVAAIGTPAVLMGVDAMLVLYLSTGTTRISQIAVPAAVTSPVGNGQANVALTPPASAAAPVTGLRAIAVVRKADLWQSGCLWVAIAAALLAVVVLAVKINNDEDGTTDF